MAFLGGISLDTVRVRLADTWDRPRRGAQRLADRIRWRGEQRTILRGPAAGLRIMTHDSSAEYAEGTNEAPVQTAVVELLRPGDTFYDVGANVGFFAMIGALCVGVEGTVVAFEAVPHVARTAAENAKLNGLEQIEVWPVAVGHAAGTASLSITDHPGGSTIATHVIPSEIVDTVEVTVVDIDSLIEQGRIPPPDVVKIDVEGHERPVLEGMHRTLVDAKPILIVEIDAANVQALGHKRDDLADLFARVGYSLTELPDSYVGTDWCVLHMIAKPA